MIYGLYVMKDEKVGFMQVQQDLNDYTAERNFKYALSQKNTLYDYASSDFSLWKVGTFDSVTGETVLEPQLKLLCRGGDFVEV